MKKRSLVSGVVAVAMAASVFTTAGAAGVSFAETNTATPGAVTTTATPGAVTTTATPGAVTTTPAVTTKTAATGTSVKVAKVTGVKAVRKTSKKAIVSWKKVKGAAGYQVKYSLKKSLKSAKTKNVAKKTKLTITGLKKNKVYYVTVKAYKKADGKKVYGKASKVVKIKKK